MRRPPAVAGQFYQGEAGRLEGQVRGLMAEPSARHEAKAVMVPHAGLVYSGAVAGAVYSSIKVPDTFVLIGPNHTGLGPRVSLMAEGSWQIPTGEVQIDSALAARLARAVPLARMDSQAHMFEHSLEVQLPFIRHLSGKAKIVPLAVMTASLEELEAIGEGVARAVGEAGYPVVIAASSDMSHFVPDATARRKDRMALDRVLELDPRGLYAVVRAEGITMCGYMPAVITLVAAKGLGAKEAVLIKYATSAEASGDYDSVVGYAGVVMK
ncbi:MAG: AmmeMemoRadiSam system protein B [Thermodesulfovibrionales bacterium]